MTTPLTFDRSALDAAVGELGLDLVVAFGSRVSGDPVPTEESDLDVAVLDPQRFTWQRFSDVRQRLSDVFWGYELDLSFLTQADPYFRFEIFRTGCRVGGDPQLYLEQEAYAFKSYVDAGLRNVLVHEYNDVDRRIVYGSIRTCIEEYRAYIDHVRTFVETREENAR